MHTRVHRKRESEQASECSFCNKLTSVVNFLVWLIPVGSVVKTLPVSTGDTSSIPGLGRSPREGNGNPLQYSFLGNHTDRGGCWKTAHGVTKESDNLATKQL